MKNKRFKIVGVTQEKKTVCATSHKEVIVGATIGRPRAFDERPYKQISAEILFSLPICDIMGWVMKMDKEKELPKRKPTTLIGGDTREGSSILPYRLLYGRASFC